VSSRLTLNLQLNAKVEHGPIGTSHAHAGVPIPLYGGLGLCGAVVEDVSACRSAIDTFKITHGVYSKNSCFPGVTEHFNMYQRARVVEAPTTPPPEEPPQQPTETVPCTPGGGLAVAGEIASGPKSTTSGQYGVVQRWSGGLGLCGATAEDVAACRAVVGTHDLKHGFAANGQACDFPEDLNVYLRTLGPASPTSEPPIPPPPTTETVLSCPTDGLAVLGLVDSSPKGTSHGQYGVVARWPGGLGICGAVVEDVAACRAMVGTHDLKHGFAAPNKIACDYPEHLNVYQRFTPVTGGPLRPVFSGTYDMKAFIRALSPSTSDLGADITGDAGPQLNLHAIIIAWHRQVTSDLGADIFGYTSYYQDLYANIKGIISAHTSPLEYEETIIATPFGMSVLRRLITKLPDLTASIQGWSLLDLGAFIVPKQLFYKDLFATVGLVAKGTADLYASITSTNYEDILASLTTIPYSAIVGIITTIPPKDLPTSLTPVPPKDLYASGGGHLPKDLLADLTVQQPFPLLAWIRVGGEGTEDLGGSITGTGGYYDLLVRIKSMTAGKKDLPVSITARVPKDIIGYITGWRESDILADITGVRVSYIGGYIKPVHTGNTKDLSVFIRTGYAGVEELDVYIAGVISAHTTDKPVNYHLFSEFPDQVLIAQRGGLSIMRLEVVRGVFPDLHATITGTPFFTKNLLAFIRPNFLEGVDLSASIYAVTQSINITKLLINIVNVSDISVFISAFSGYNPLAANIRGTASVNTNTPSGSGWVYTSTSIRFYLGTNKGLVIPNRVQSVIRPEVFLNYSLTPDLWAYVYGWETTELSASIGVQLFSVFPASITALDFSHISNLSASVVSIYTYDLLASVSGVGGFSDLSSDISPVGGAFDLSASIRPYLKILGFRLIAVETQPFLDLRAILNPIGACGYTSTISNLTAFIRAQTKPVGQGELYASIFPYTDRLDISASIIGRRKVLYKFVDVSFRARTRLSSSISAILVGVGNGTGDLVASITGLYHESDITADITPVRYYIRTRDPVGTIDIYREQGLNAYLYKTLELTFASRVLDYIYDAVDNAVYPIGDGKWVLDVSELTLVDSFFDRSPLDRKKSLGDITEYDSIDEAIRAVIVLLTEGYSSDMTASITATGGYSAISALVIPQKRDKVSDLYASVTLVTNLPDLYASISAYSGYNPLKAFIIGYSTQAPDITADIYGVVHDSIAASITGVT